MQMHAKVTGLSNTKHYPHHHRIPQSIVSPILTTLSFLLLLATSLNAQAVFTTPGQFSVGQGGEAGYSIPIQVPPGTAGMAPSLSLSYSSNGGNGTLGLGWGIQGMSQISRCPQSIIQDGATRGINYDTADKYCLDGQRLISTGGTYGADSTEYRTEQANFAKIISYGTAGNGPAWFKVWTKGGQIIEYGNTGDSRIEAAGITTVKTWGVNKISDTLGNYLTVSYFEDNPNGEAYVTQIDYTGNATSSPALAPYARVLFTYVTRPDTTSTTFNGSVIKLQHRLTDVQTYINTNTTPVLVKDYKLTYTNTGAYHVNASNVADGSVLTQVQECDGNATTPSCQKPTSFNWTIGSNPTNTFGTAQTWGLPANTQILASGDVNGDGRADVVYVTAATSLLNPSAEYYLALSNGAGFSTVQDLGLLTGVGMTCTGTIVQSCSNVSWPALSIADVNGDGLGDLSFNNTVRLSAGNSLQAAQTWGIPTTAKILASGDVNGDGRADVVYVTAATSLLNPSAEYYLALSNGAGFSTVQDLGLLTGVGMTCTGTIVQSCSNVSWPALSIADVNGDGLGDLSFNNTVRLSAGNSLQAAQTWGIPTTAKILASGDVNGDGRADVVYVTAATSLLNPSAEYYLALSNGAGFSTVQDLGLLTGVGMTCTGTIVQSCSNVSWPALSIADVNGDSLRDLGMNTTVSLSSSSVPDLLNSVNNGLGSVQSVVYKTLADSATYTMDTGAAASAYPIRDIPPAVPMYVVSSVTSSDGIGGNVTTNYTYGGLKAQMTGRGLLGFRWMKTATPDTDTYVSSFYRQDYPYTGLPSQTEKHLISNNNFLAASQQTYANSPLTTGSAVSQFPYVSQTVEQHFELDGSLVSTTTTTNQYDSYGNITQIAVNDGAGNTKTTNNTYNNDTAKWLLGRLLRSNVTAVNATTLPTLPTPQQVWTTCAGEYGTCSFVGTYTVRYGATGQYLTGTFTNGLDCNNGTFGSDPAPGATKSCQVLNLAPAQPSWINCAGEGGTCTFTGTYPVRYGGNGMYVTGTYTNSVACNNTTFGSDPAPGLGKACDVLK